MVRVKVIDKEYKKKILGLYSKFVGTDSKKARNLVKKLDYERDPDLLERIAQTYFDESLFNTDGSQREWFDGRKLKLAEKYIIEAYNLNENSIYVLWTLGKIRKAYNQKDLAIYCFKRIIEIGKRKITGQKQIVDFVILQSKINDSKFELYRLYYLKGDLACAKKYLNSYKGGLKKGVYTLYSPIEKYLVDL